MVSLENYQLKNFFQKIEEEETFLNFFMSWEFLKPKPNTVLIEKKEK